jgi:parallel beta-helix repeat protein
MAMEDMPGKTGHDLVIIEDNELYQNNISGIRTRGSIPVTIKTCKIYSNGRAGIAIDRYSEGLVTGCNVFQNGRAGINIDQAARSTIENSKIYKNKMAGVRIQRSGKKEKRVRVLEVKIASNRIYSNDEAGIRSMPQPDSKVDLAIIGNDIYQNNKAGVRVENNTKLTAKGNKIHDNGRAGIVSYVSVIPPIIDIYQNRVSFNRGPGIHVLNGITGRIGIRNNWVFNNQRSGILCGLWSSPDIQLLNVEIINNTVVSNGSSDEGAGIRNDGKGKVIIMNNIVAYNYVTGIRTKGCQEYSYNLLFANGDVGNCCDDLNSAPYWVERRQFAGCPERGKGDLICDPLFVDPDNYSFYLQDESPAIDAGKHMHIYNDTSFPPSKATNRNDMGATGGPYAAR